MHFRKYFLIYTIIPLLILTIGATYYRFVVLHDYRVSYEGSCDPYKSQCYVGCADDECTENYYYTHVERYSSDLYNLCGRDITSCEVSNYCTPEEVNCSVSYCDLETEEDCETLNIDDLEQDKNINY
jgi:hypothetical protein